MSKREFIDRLRAALSGRIPAAQVEDTINYYQDYIHVEIRNGKSEEEVLRALGDPRLIARTIIQTNGAAKEGDYQTSGYQDSGYQDSNYQGSYNEYQAKPRSFRLPGWLVTLIILLVLFLIVSLIFSVLSFLAPVLLVLAAVLFMVKLFGDWLN